MPQWYTDLIDAVAAGEQQYLECDDCGAAALPPRTLCPTCGSASLVARPLSSTATVRSFTEIHVTTPTFHGTTPYTVVLATFEEGVALTGQLRGAESVAVGDAVVLGSEAVTEDHAVLTFTPATDAE